MVEIEVVALVTVGMVVVVPGVPDTTGNSRTAEMHCETSVLILHACTGFT